MDPTNIAPFLQEFIVTFKASLDVRLWRKLVEEELTELKEALEGDDKAAILKESADLLYVMVPFTELGTAVLQMGLLNEEEDAEWGSLVLDVTDTLTRVLAQEPYKSVIGEAVCRVHASNMSKVGEDGKPILREDGKIMKGPNYKPPVLDDLVAEAA